LARDVERWLDDQPVSAWSEPLPVRARRWARRHRVLLTGCAAAVFVGLVSLVIATAALTQAELRVVQEKGQAKINRLAAEQKAEVARQIPDYLLQIFATADPLGLDDSGFRGGGENPEGATARRLLDRGAALARTHLREQPVLRAALLDAMGNTYRSLGEWD